MHSSASSSEAQTIRSGFIRSTASDRPGVAQPVPERDIPRQPWSVIVLGTLALSVVLIGAWEYHWRRFGAEPGYRNSNGEWAEQRRRIDRGEGTRTVMIGSSRTLFDIQLDEWKRVTVTVRSSSPLKARRRCPP